MYSKNTSSTISVNTTPSPLRTKGTLYSWATSCNMASLVASYEQQYSVLTAELTARIGKLKIQGHENDERLAKEIQSNFEEANDLLEQLELEVRGAGGGALGSRVPAYRAELQRIRDEYAAVSRSTNTFHNAEGDDVYEDWSGASDQKQRLLDNSERLERTGRNLTEGYRIVLETEQIGAAVLQDLSVQRETIQRSRGRLREADEHLTRSSRLMNSMIVRSLQERFILVVVLFVVGVLLCTGFYFYIK